MALTDGLEAPTQENGDGTAAPVMLPAIAPVRRLLWAPGNDAYGGVVRKKTMATIFGAKAPLEAGTAT
jgi:hypothetical protein